MLVKMDVTFRESKLDYGIRSDAIFSFDDTSFPSIDGDGWEREIEQMKQSVPS